MICGKRLRLTPCGGGRPHTFAVAVGGGIVSVTVAGEEGVMRDVLHVDLVYRESDVGGFDLATWEAEAAWRAWFGPLVDLPAEAVIGREGEGEGEGES